MFFAIPQYVLHHEQLVDEEVNRQHSTSVPIRGSGVNQHRLGGDRLDTTFVSKGVVVREELGYDDQLWILEQQLLHKSASMLDVNE